MPSVLAHVQRYHDALEPELVARGFGSLRASFDEGRSGILALTPPPGESAVELVKRLASAKIYAASPDGNLRFSPHFANEPGEIEAVLRALE